MSLKTDKGDKMSIRVGTIVIPLVTEETDQGHVTYIPCEGHITDNCIGIVTNTDIADKADEYEDAYVSVRWVQMCGKHANLYKKSDNVHISNLWEVGQLA